MDTVESELDTLGRSAEASDLAAPVVGHPGTAAATVGALAPLGALHRDFAWQRRSLATIRGDQSNVGFGNHFVDSEIPGIMDNFRSTLAEQRRELHPALRNRVRVDHHEGASLGNTYRRVASAFAGPL